MWFNVIAVVYVSLLVGTEKNGICQRGQDNHGQVQQLFVSEFEFAVSC